jgi:hypothetical protein
LLDREESRLTAGARNGHVGDAIQKLLVALISREPGLQSEDLGTRAQDIVAMTQALTDRAGECGETTSAAWKSG